MKGLPWKFGLIFFAAAVLIFSASALANAPVNLDTPEPDVTETPAPVKPEAPYREWVEPTPAPPNWAVFTVGFSLAALVVIGMIVLGYFILKGRDKSPQEDK